MDVTSKRIDNVENEELSALRENTNKVKATCKLEDKLLLYEIHDRKLHLLLHGIEKQVNENVYATVHSIVVDL